MYFCYLNVVFPESIAKWNFFYFFIFSFYWIPDQFSPWKWGGFSETRYQGNNRKALFNEFPNYENKPRRRLQKERFYDDKKKTASQKPDYKILINWSGILYVILLIYYCYLRNFIWKKIILQSFYKMFDKLKLTLLSFFTRRKLELRSPDTMFWLS